MSRDFYSLLIEEDGKWSSWRESAIRDLDESDVLEWIRARMVGQRTDGFPSPGDRWNHEHEADIFFHLASKLQEWRDVMMDYPEFSEILYSASAKFLEDCDREEVGYRNVAAFCWQLASCGTYVRDPEAAKSLVADYRDLVLSEKFSWWSPDSFTWTRGITERSTQTEAELNIQNMLQRALLRLQAQTGERGDDPELVEHFTRYEARTKTFIEAFTGKLAFCGELPDEGWLKTYKPFWHFYKMYAREADEWSPTTLCQKVRQAYSFPYSVRSPEYHRESTKRLAHELSRYNVRKIRRGWDSQDVWEEVREGIEKDLASLNEYERRDKEPLSEDEFWPMPKKLEDVETL